MFVGYPQTLWGLGNGSRTFRKVFFDLSRSTVATQVDLDARGKEGVSKKGLGQPPWGVALAQASMQRASFNQGPPAEVWEKVNSQFLCHFV